MFQKNKQEATSDTNENKVITKKTPEKSDEKSNNYRNFQSDDR